MTVAFLFPGQSSRYPGLLSKLTALEPECEAIAARASEILGFDALAHYDRPTEEAFARNVDVQIGVFLANHLWMRTLESRGVHASISAGLSLGEWNHLVHIGAVSFEEALRAVRARGEAYDAGPRGFMASIQPVDLEDLQTVVTGVRQQESLGVVEVVNLNSPRQHVVAGDQAAVEEVMRVMEDEHFAQPVVIERQVPMHASSFSPVGAQFRTVLAEIEFRDPARPYFPNRLGRQLAAPTQTHFEDLLSTHVHSPVLWKDTIDAIVAQHPDVVFVEVGPMKVLFNLLHRKWVKNKKFHADVREEVEMHLQQLVASVSEATRGAAEARV